MVIIVFVIKDAVEGGLCLAFLLWLHHSDHRFHSAIPMKSDALQITGLEKSKPWFDGNPAVEPLDTETGSNPNLLAVSCQKAHHIRYSEARRDAFYRKKE